MLQGNRKLDVAAAPSSEEALDPLAEVFHRALMEAVRDAVAAVDPQGVVLFANGKAREALGTAPGGDLKGLPSPLAVSIQRICRKGEGRADVPLRTEKGSWTARLEAVLWQGALAGVLCVLEDTSELERVRRRLLSSQELSRELDAIIESSHDGLWICDAQANVLRINPASERINNIRARDVTGRNMRDLVAEGFIDRSATVEVIRQGKVVNLLQRTREGRKLMITGSPVFDADKRLIRVVVNERDVTEIDALYEELREQEAMNDQFRHHLLEMQLAELESRRIIARSPSMVNVLRQALKVSAVESTVLVLGESGVGKGMIAELIHKYSARFRQPMITLDCGTVPETLVESELFGYEKGAFTGASARGKPGYFELADGGILFLDEIAELPLSSQVKLLRFLEKGEIKRVGGTERRKVDVRVLAATNRDLEAMVKEGLFRRDLYYRLNVIPVRIPPLRERREAILPLIHHYADHFSRKLGVPRRWRFTSEASEALLSYAYPGNVRELMNLCERLVVMTEGDRVDVEDLPRDVARAWRGEDASLGAWREGLTLGEVLESVEREALREALLRHGSQWGAARALGINQSTVARKLRKHGLKSGGPSRLCEDA